MRRINACLLIVSLCVAACTSAAGTQSVQVPTLAVLPTLTPTRDPSLPTISPTITPTFTLSPIPTIPPTLTPTPRPPCDISAWWKQSGPTVVTFLDTAEIAGSTPRASLSPILVDLRQTERSFEAFDTEPCLHDIYFDIWLGMDFSVSGFTSFLGQDQDSADAFFAAASQALYDAYLNLPIILLPDYRMNNASLIWGGAAPSDAVATSLAATHTAQNTGSS